MYVKHYVALEPEMKEKKKGEEAKFSHVAYAADFEILVPGTM